jgi:hypothetical protein
MLKPLFASIILLVGISSLVAASHEPNIAPEVRREDVPQISAVIRRITSERIITITALESPKWPHHIDPDLVMIRTCCTTDITGDGFKLQKRAGRWVVTWKGTWIR